MATVEQIREALEQAPGGVRLYIALRTGEQLWCSSTWMLDGDEMVVYHRGRPRTIGLDQVADVGLVIVTRSAAHAAA